MTHQMITPNHVEIAIDERPDHDCILINLADVESKPIEWLWPDRFPLGKLCLIGGPPSMGKTQIALWIAAAVTTGGKWPDSDEHAVIGDVLILSTEDDVADTIKPRLEAAGADVSGVHVLQAVLEVSEDEIVERQFSLSRHIEEITGVLKSNPEIRLIVLDPLSAFLGVKDSHRDSDVREVLGPLAQLAAELCVTVIGIVHLNKTQSSDPMARFIGSTGIIASARSAYLVHGDDDE